MNAALSTIAQQLFRIRPEELRRVTFAFVYLFSAIGAFIIARIVRTVLFLEIPNYKDQLPLTYIGIALSVSLVMYVYARVERKLRRDQTNIITGIILLVVTLGFRVALRHASAALYWAFYIWVEILGSFLVVQFWSFANEIFHSRQAKRLFAVIGGGGVLANIAFGFGASGAAKLFGTENLLFAICGCILVCLAMIFLLGQDARAELTQALERTPSRQTNAQAPAQGVFATRHVRLIAAVIVLTYIVSTLVDYQFQVIVGDSIPGKDDRSAYFGSFFGITGILGGFIQFFLTSRILERFGVLAALTLLPAGMLTGSIGLLLVPLVPGLMMAGVTKGAENVLRYTINDSTLQLLYLPVPSHLRGRAKAFIDGILRPLSVGGAGFILALLVGQVEKLLGADWGLRVSVYNLSWVVGAALGGWLGVTYLLKKEYIKSLVQTLQRRRLNFGDAKFSLTDDETLSTLDKSLGSDKIVDVLNALEMLSICAPAGRIAGFARVALLLHHQSELVREGALRYLGRAHAHGAPAFNIDLEELLHDAAPGVRAAAAHTVCAIKHEKALAKVHVLLEDPELKVRAAAVAALVGFGGLDGVLACADQLKGMLSSASATEREQAAWILGEVGVRNFYQPLIPLLQDRDERVRRAAIAAAARVRSPELIPLLLEALARPHLAGTAVVALTAHGPMMVDVISELLQDTQRSPRIRAQACRVLAKLGDSRAVDVLVRHLSDDHWRVRNSVLSALTSVLHAFPSSTFDPERVDEALHKEIEQTYALLAMTLDLRLDAGALLLTDALNHRLEMGRRRILALLGLKYSAVTIDLVSRNLQSSQPATRANAVEVLDNLLTNDEKLLIVPLFDDAPVQRTVDVATPLLKLHRTDRITRLRVLLADGDHWLQSVAALTVAAWEIKELEQAVVALLDCADPVCRETAIVAVRKIGGRDTLQRRLQPLLTDSARAVSRYAQAVLAESAL